MPDEEKPGAGRMTAAEFRALYDWLRGQAQPAAGGRPGGLANITRATIAAAAREVRLGRSVSMAAPVEYRAGPDNPDPCVHEMTGPDAADRDGPGLAFAMDRLSMNVHGNADSHLDALCHVIYDGTLHGGVPADTVTGRGATALSIDLVADGIVGRGVLLDIPRLRGVPWLEPGDHVMPEDLLAAEEAQRVRVGPGDLLFVRVGHRLRRQELGSWDAAASRAGLHPTTMRLVAERRVAVLGSDSNNDTAASAAEGVDFPVHVLAINALGVHLLDYLQFTDLVPLCEEAGRWSFLCVIAPLRLTAGTGSPVNPIAVL